MNLRVAHAVAHSLSALLLASALSATWAAIPPVAVRATGTSLDTTKYSVVVHVATTGSDAATGVDEASAVRSVNKAFALAQPHLNQNQGVKILMHPGLYRIDTTIRIDGSALTATGKDALLILQGAEKGAVVVCGSVSWPASTWTLVNQDSLLYSHPWPYRFDGTTTSTPGTDFELGDHNETVFLNGKLLDQRPTRRMTANKFFVDDNGGMLYIRPGRELVSTDSVEAAVKLRLLRVANKNNFVLKNIIFRHEASWIGGHGNDGDGWGVAVGMRSETAASHDMLIEDCEFSATNACGLKFHQWTNVTIRRCTANSNGWKGIGFSSSTNVLMEDNETSYNAFRQGWTHGTGVDAAGLKIIPGNSKVTVVRHYADSNCIASGIWCDWDNRDVTLDGCVLVKHIFYPIYFEASTGALTMVNCTIRQSPSAIYLFGQSNLRIEGCRFESITGSICGATTDASAQRATNENFYVRRCYVNTTGSSTWSGNARFINTLDIDSNTYWCGPNTITKKVFVDSAGFTATFPTWQTLGKDVHSTWLTEAPVVGAGNPPAVSKPRRDGSMSVSGAGHSTYLITGAGSVRVLDTRGRLVSSFHGHTNGPFTVTLPGAGVYLVQTVPTATNPIRETARITVPGSN